MRNIKDNLKFLKIIIILIIVKIIINIFNVFYFMGDALIFINIIISIPMLIFCIYYLYPSKNKNNISLETYYKNSYKKFKLNKNPRVKFGIVLFTELYRVKPNLAIKVMNTQYDPSTKGEYEELTPFFNWLHTEWER